MSTHGADEEGSGIAGAFRGLADPYRLRVFAVLQELESEERLADPGSRELPNVVESIARTANISPTLVEHHLMELRRAGLVTIDEGPRGQAVVAIDHEQVALIKSILDPDPPEGP